MAHTFGTSVRLPATNGYVTDNPAPIAINCPAGTTVLWLFISVSGTTHRTGGSPTYNGVAMTQIGTTQDAGGTPETNAEQWCMLDPPTGSSYNISVPNAGALSLALIAATGAAAAGNASVLDASAQIPGNSTNPSTTVNTTVAGDIWFGGVGNGATTWNPSGRSGTQLYDWDAGSKGLGAQYALPAGTGNQTVSWTFGTSEDWVIMAASFKEVSLPLNKVVNESESIVEAQERDMTLRRIGSETVQLTEASVLVRTLRRVVAEAVSLAETVINALVPSGLQLKKVVGEAVQVAETVLRARQMVRAKNEGVQLGEAMTRVRSMVRASGETVNIAETRAALRMLYKVVNDAVQLAEGRLRSLQINRQIAESMQVAESVRRARAMTRVKSEAEQIGETSLRSRAMARVRNETVQVGELATKAVSQLIVRLIGEGVAIAESVVRGLTAVRQAVETMMVADVLLRNLSYRCTVSEQTNIGEQVVRLRSFSKVVAETMSIGEQAVYWIGVVSFTIVRAVAESVQVSEFATVLGVAAALGRRASVFFMDAARRALHVR